jgi:Signal transduction histidine kinase
MKHFDYTDRMHFGLPISFYSALLIISALVCLLLAARAWYSSKKDLAHAFALYQTLAFIWCIFRLVQWEMPLPYEQLEALKLQYLGVVFIPATFVLVARALVKRTVSSPLFFLAFLPGFICLGLVATNDIYGFFWIGREADLYGYMPINPPGNWGFWLCVAYGAIYIAYAFAVMVRVVLKAQGMYARWLWRLIGFFFLPFVAWIAYLIFWNERTPYDPIPVAFGLSGLLLAYSLRHFDFLEEVPYAKSVVLESINTPILIVDSMGLVVGANVNSRRLFARLGELEGRRVADLISPLADSLVDKATTEWFYDGVDWLISCYVIHKGGWRWRNRILLLRDISALAKARREVEAARAAADAASSAKSAFVATVSHELRNPLNAIIGLADLDLRADPPDAFKEDLEVIKSSGNLLLGLVNDLLDLSKIEAGRMDLETIDFDLYEKAKSVLRVFRAATEKKGVFLDISIREGTPRYVIGDPLRYGQVLMNLVSNAVKFTESGAITVTLEPLRNRDEAAATAVAAMAVAEDRRSLCVLCSVSDTGIGIAEEKIPKLFQEFAQADSSVSRRFGGTGLGLSLSKRLVELFGGDIWVKSVEGAGSVFSFTARFEPGDPARVESSTHVYSPEFAPERELSVLIVDDDPINNAVAQRYIERFGHFSASAGSGNSALALLGEGNFDLVLLDLGLPDMDGFEACRRIRAETASGQAGNMPIVAMTARGESGLRTACAAAGMMDCLSKPLDPSALETVLVRAERAARELGPRAAASVPREAESLMSSASRAAESASSPPNPGQPLLDRDSLLERIDGDEAFMRELLGIFIEEAPDRTWVFETALAAGDLEMLHRAAHALKGSALSLCAQPLSAAASSLEAAAVAAKKEGKPVVQGAGALADDIQALIELLKKSVEAAKAILDE